MTKLYSIIFKPLKDWEPAYEHSVWENLKLANEAAELFGWAWGDVGRWFACERQPGKCDYVCGSEDFKRLTDMAYDAIESLEEDRQVVHEINQR